MNNKKYYTDNMGNVFFIHEESSDFKNDSLSRKSFTTAIDSNRLAEIMTLISSDSPYRQTEKSYKSFCDKALTIGRNNYFDGIFFYVLEDVIIGFITFKVMEEISEIDFFCVDPKNRCLGHGSAFFKLFLSYLSNEVNVSKVILEVSDKNQTAIAFYEKQGFKEISSRKNYYKDSSNALIMELILSAQK